MQRRASQPPPVVSEEHPCLRPYNGSTDFKISHVGIHIFITNEERRSGRCKRTKNERTNEQANENEQSVLSSKTERAAKTDTTDRSDGRTTTPPSKRYAVSRAHSPRPGPAHARDAVAIARAQHPTPVLISSNFPSIHNPHATPPLPAPPPPLCYDRRCRCHRCCRRRHDG